jgi:8-oxo-dGTP pyrophosphatase MutT (NUDIX family)
MNIQPEKIKIILSQVQEPDLDVCPPLPGVQPDGVQSAAVLLPLLKEQGSWKMLFIKRTHQQADRHSGQIAFPGGRAEFGDSHLLATALRETEEEIGVNPADVQILGQSCPITTVTDYQVSPFVGILPWPYPLQPSADEVDKIVIIPLKWLNDPHNREIRSWESPTAPERKIPVIFYKEFAGEVLWGASARITLDFLDLIKPGS